MTLTFTNIVIVSVLLLLASCVTPIIKLPSNYFENRNKVGIIYNIDTNHFQRSGQQSLLYVFLTPGDKYFQLTQRLRKDIDLNNEIKDLYGEIFSKKSKDLVSINLTQQEFNDLPDFNKTSNSTTTYFHEKDLQFLKQKGIDDLLIVDVSYGISIYYYGFIETSKTAQCKIESQIIDLSNNQIVYRDVSHLTEPLKAKADPRNKEGELDEKMFNGIKKIIPKTFDLERSKFIKTQ